MFDKNTKRKLNAENKSEFGVCIAALMVFLSTLWIGYHKFYQPEKRAYLKGTKQMYVLLKKELKEYYDKHEYIFDSNVQITDTFCEYLNEKYSNYKGVCTVGVGADDANLFFDKDIEVYGFTQPPFKFGKTLAKDIIVDVNGSKGANEIGVDRMGFRIYSNLYGGGIAPINCNMDDEINYDFKKSIYCPMGKEINYMDLKEPINFSVYQIDENGERLKQIANDVSYLRDRKSVV